MVQFKCFNLCFWNFTDSPVANSFRENVLVSLGESLRISLYSLFSLELFPPEFQPLIFQLSAQLLCFARHSIIFLAFLISLSSALPETTQRKILIVSKLNTFSSLTFDPHPGAIKPHESVIRSPFLSPASVSLPRVHALLQFILSFFDCCVTSLSPARFPRGLSVLSGPHISYYRKKTSYSPSPPRTIADENTFVPVARVPRDWSHRECPRRSLEKQHERKCISWNVIYLSNIYRVTFFRFVSRTFSIRHRFIISVWFYFLYFCGRTWI